MIFENSKNALNWMVNHPLEKLYVDEYGKIYDISVLYRYPVKNRNDKGVLWIAG